MQAIHQIKIISQNAIWYMYGSLQVVCVITRIKYVGEIIYREKYFKLKANIHLTDEKMKTHYCKMTEYRKNIQFTTAFSMLGNHMQELSRNISHAHITTFNAGDE